MIKNKQKVISNKIEKVFIVAGLSLIGIGIVADLYGAYANSRFIQDALALVYYFQHILLLGGGFAIGYFITKKPKGWRSDGLLFNSVFYALLAIALYWIADMLRLPIRSLFGDFPYPWGRIFFYGMVVVALIAALAVAYFIRRKASQPQLTSSEKITLITAFIGSQIFFLASSVYYLLTGIASYGSSTIWMIIASYLTLPLIVSLASYLLLPAMKRRLDRLFYAALVGIFYYALTIVLWEFRTDASADATNIFSNIVTAFTLITVSLIVWRLRKAIR